MTNVLRNNVVIGHGLLGRVLIFHEALEKGHFLRISDFAGVYLCPHFVDSRTDKLKGCDH